MSPFPRNILALPSMGYGESWPNTTSLLLLFVCFEIILGLSIILFPSKFLLAGLAWLVAFLIFVYNPLFGLLAFVFSFPFNLLYTVDIGKATLRPQDYVLLTTIAAAFVHYAMKRKFFLEKSGIDANLLAVLFYVFLSLLWSTSPSKGFFLYVQIFFAMFVAYFFVINCIRSKRDLDLVIDFWILVVCVIAILGILEFVGTGVPKVAILKSRGVIDADWVRAGGSSVRTNLYLQTANRLGFFLNFGIALTIYRIVTGESKKQKTLFFIAFSIMVFALITTLSRSSWLAFGVIFILSFYRFREFRKMIFLAIPCLMVAFLLIAGFMYFETVYYRFSTLFGNPQDIVPRRVAKWELSLEAFLANPLLGTGLGELGQMTIGLTPHPGRGAHSLYVYILSEFGVVGALLFLLLIVKIFVQVRSAYKTSQSAIERVLIWCFFMGLTVPLVQGMTAGFTFLRERIVWAFIGLAMVTMRIVRKGNTGQTQGVEGK